MKQLQKFIKTFFSNLLVNSSILLEMKNNQQFYESIE